MTTSGLQAANRQKAEELDSMKESISDIINQLQDIDPTRLSFSPFLDLDTQISLAPVSDSPESSVEELHSSSHSVSGSQNSLEPAPVAQQPANCTPCHRQPGETRLPDEPRADQSEKREEVGDGQRELDQSVSSPAVAVRHLDGGTEKNQVGCPSAGDVPNGTDTARWSPETTNLDSAADEEGRPLIAPPPESVELAVWSPEGGGEPGPADLEAPQQGRCCCCCQSGRLPAFFSVLASLLSAAAIFYGLYFYVPIKPPDCPDPARRIVFTLCCCVVAAVPVLLVMLLGAVCQFCTGSLDLQEATPRGRSVQLVFVTASLQLLFLYVLNLVVMAALLPHDQLKLVPILVAMFILGRLVYWVSLNTCSSWRGFGSGLTVFPLLATVALNLFLIYSLSLKEPLFGSQDVLYNQVTAPSWSGETSQSPSGTPDILDAQ